MKRKLILLAIVLFSLSSCGYSPIYNNQSINNINLKINEINGNDIMNNIVRSQIKKYENSSLEKIILVNIKQIIPKIYCQKIKRARLQII